MANVVEKVQDFIEDFITDTLSGMAQSCLVRAGNTITDVADLMGDSVTETPQEWNGGTVFTTLKTISETAIIPLAVSILAIIICYDLISAVMDSNNMKEFDLGIFLRFGIKGWVAIYFMNNSFTICEAFFEIGAWIAKTASEKLNGEAIEEMETLSSSGFKNVLSSLSIGDLGIACILSLIVYIISIAVMVIVMVVTAGRMIEILIYFSAAPIPFATMTNKEWNNVGYSFLKNILALALQAFFIVVVLSIYVTLFTSNVTGLEEVKGLKSLTEVLLQWICYSIICCFTLLKTGSISKSICGAH
ncbi:MAG: hypothetical protein K2I06_09980 [Ruminococcus sp.]|nr:hypothetical protein [Ruminococcus sp.]